MHFLLELDQHSYFPVNCALLADFAVFVNSDHFHFVFGSFSSPKNADRWELSEYNTRTPGSFLEFDPLDKICEKKTVSVLNY